MKVECMKCGRVREVSKDTYYKLRVPLCECGWNHFLPVGRDKIVIKDTN